MMNPEIGLEVLTGSFGINHQDKPRLIVFTQNQGRELVENGIALYLEFLKKLKREPVYDDSLRFYEGLLSLAGVKVVEPSQNVDVYDGGRHIRFYPDLFDNDSKGSYFMSVETKDLDEKTRRNIGDLIEVHGYKRFRNGSNS